MTYQAITPLFATLAILGLSACDGPGYAAGDGLSFVEAHRIDSDLSAVEFAAADTNGDYALSQEEFDDIDSDDLKD